MDVGAILPSHIEHETSANLATSDTAYLKTLLECYEEEIVGVAYFEGLADICTVPEHKAKMRLLAQVEQHTVDIVASLISQYGLTVRDRQTIVAEGAADALKGPQDWEGMMAYMRKIFPTYVADFERLERMAPPQDVAILKRMTEHEVVAIAFLELEAKGAADAVAPLQRFLARPIATISNAA